MNGSDENDIQMRSGVDILQISREIIGDVPKISEQVFVSRILPMFVKKATDEQFIDVGLWMEYAGSMQRPLDVVGANGEVLYRAPSPLQSVIRLNKRTDDGNPSLLQIVAKAKQKADVHPKLGETYLSNELMELDIIQDIDNRETIQTWITILQRYGYLSPTEKNTAPTSTESPKQMTFSDDDDPL